MKMEDFENVRRQMAQRQLERDQILRQQVGDGQNSLLTSSTLVIQRVGRGYIGRKKVCLFAVDDYDVIL